MTRLVPVVLALLVGAGVGAGVTALILADDDVPAAADAAVRPPRESLLARPPAGPVSVVTETVRLPAGFVSRHRHGGPTINLVRSGALEITNPGGTARYGRGESFVEPTGRVHTIRVVEDARIDVVRLLPRGAEATTEVPRG